VLLDVEGAAAWIAIFRQHFLSILIANLSVGGGKTCRNDGTARASCCASYRTRKYPSLFK
jgi:hypothetical protein